MVCSSKGQGEVAQIFYIGTDKNVYEVGQNANITAAWYIDYGDGFNCSEAAISCLRGGSIIGSKQWFNEPQGYHVHHALFQLDPEDWNPSETGENGTANCLLSLPMSDEYTYEELYCAFTVKRARQDCSLINVTPAQPAANASSVSLFFRVYNVNNSSFGIGLNSVYCNVTDPFGRTLIVNNKMTTDTGGNFMISYNPNYTRGDYSVSLISSENGKYLEGRFIHNLTVGSSPTPTALKANWRYAGNTFNSTETYAMEPVEISAHLTQTLDGTGISYQRIEFDVLDSLNSETASQSTETTNASGFATHTLVVPHGGKFILKASYGGLQGAWLSSRDTAVYSIGARVREVSIAEIVGPPPVVNLGQEYDVKYIAFDVLSRCPVSELSVMLNANDLLLANATTDVDGTIRLSMRIPTDRWDLTGNLTLSIETYPRSAVGVYGNTSLSRHLLCKIPTITTLSVYPRDAVEDGETILVSAQLLSSNLTPISAEQVTFTVFTNQRSSPSITMTEVTDSKGMCNALLKMSGLGSAIVVANFSGNFVFNYSNDTYSISVFPEFSERLSSSILVTSLTCLLSIISVRFLRKAKHKATWSHVSIR
jgi:hypothetical protein